MGRSETKVRLREGNVSVTVIILWLYLGDTVGEILGYIRRLTQLNLVSWRRAKKCIPWAGASKCSV